MQVFRNGRRRAFLNIETTNMVVQCFHWWHHVLTIVMYLKLSMSYYAGSRKPETMPPEWLLVPKSRNTLRQFQKIFTGCPSGRGYSSRFWFWLSNACKDVLLYTELLVKQATTRSLRSNTKNLLQVARTNLNRCEDMAFFAYELYERAPRQ